MASEIFYSGIGDARLAAALSMDMQLIIADRFSLYGHPAIMYAGDAAASGSTAIKVPIPSLNGVNRFAAVAENASVANTALTLTSVTVTIARQALQRSASDLANLTDSVGLNNAALVTDMVGGAYMRFTEQMCNILDDFTATVGTTTVDMSVDDWFSADFTLTQASVPKMGRLGVLYPVQLTDLQNSVRAESGAFQYRSDVQGFLAAGGPGVIGSLLGNDIAASSLVPTANAGADSAGALFGPGAVVYADGTPAPIRGGSEVVFPAGTKIYVEIARDPSGALTNITGNYMVGVSILQQAAGVSIITDR